MLNDAISQVPPVRGTPEEMQQILEHRRTMVRGFGLPAETRGQFESPRVPRQRFAVIGLGFHPATRRIIG